MGLISRVSSRTYRNNMPRPRRLINTNKTKLIPKNTTKYDVISAFGIDTRCLDCHFTQNHDKQNCLYEIITRKSLATSCLPFDNLTVSTDSSGLINESTNLKLGILEINFGKDCDIFRTRVHRVYDEENEGPSYLVIALENGFFNKSVVKNAFEDYQDSFHGLDLTKRNDCDAKIMLVVRFGKTESILLDKVIKYVSKQSRMSEAHQLDRLNKKEFINYSIPGKFRTLLKHHVSDKVYRVIGRSPKSVDDKISHLEMTRSKTRDSLQKIETKPSEEFESEDSGSMIDFDLKSHKIKRQRKRKSSNNDSEDDEDERYFGLSPEVVKRSRDERLLGRIVSKEDNILNQKIKDFKKRPKSNKVNVRRRLFQ